MSVPMNIRTRLNVNKTFNKRLSLFRFVVLYHLIDFLSYNRNNFYFLLSMRMNELSGHLFIKRFVTGILQILPLYK